MATNIGPSPLVQGQVSFTTAQELIISQSDDSIVTYGNDGVTNRAIKTDSSGELQVDVLSSALPSGAATSAKQDTGNSSLSSIDGKITAVNTGAVVVSSSALPSGAAAESTLSTFSAKHTAATASVSAVPRSGSSGTAFSLNTSRKGMIVTNDTGAICYIRYGSGAASSTDYTFRLTANSMHEMQFPIYTGQATVIWASGGAGNLLVTELT